MPKGTPVAAPITPAGLDAIVATEAASLGLDARKAADRVAILASIAENSADPYRISAARALHDIEMAAGDVKGLAPPLTPSDRITCLAQILDSASDEELSEALALRAAKRSVGNANVPDPQTPAPDPLDSGSSPSGGDLDRFSPGSPLRWSPDGPSPNGPGREPDDRLPSSPDPEGDPLGS